MQDYPNGIGQWEERDGIRTEVFHDGAWVVYTTRGEFRSIASADDSRNGRMDIERAKREAMNARQILTTELKHPFDP